MKNEKTRRSATAILFGNPGDGIRKLRIDYTVGAFNGKPLMMTAMVSCQEDGTWSYIVDGVGDMAFAERVGECISRQLSSVKRAKGAYRAVRRAAPGAEMRVDGLFYSLGSGFPSQNAALAFINAALLPIWAETLSVVASCAAEGDSWRAAAKKAGAKFPDAAMAPHIYIKRRDLREKADEGAAADTCISETRFCTE